jgi:PAS domain S-box-containing protein
MTASAPTSATVDRVASPRSDSILLVEDSRTQLQAMRQSLSVLPARILTASTGAEAERILQSETVTLVLVDYELPDVSAGELVDRLQAARILPPFVVITARGTEQVAVSMMKRGAIDYLIKDGAFCEMLPTVVERLLKRLKVDRILKEAEDSVRRSQQRMRQIVDSNPDAFVSILADGTVMDWNRSAESMFGLPRDHALGSNVLDTIVPPQHRAACGELMQQFRRNPDGFPHQRRLQTAVIDREGREIPVEVCLTAVESESVWLINAFIRDVSKRLELETQLVQSEKMASLGQLAAGVAHEINNPIAYVLSNLGTLQEYVEVFQSVIQGYQATAEAAVAGDLEEVGRSVNRVRELRSRERYDDILADIGELFEDSGEGLLRVKDIVQNLKSFVRLDEAEVKEADLNESLQTTLKVVANELRYKCDVKLDLGEIPRLRCYAGQLNQVFMNLLMNAAQAIGDHGEVTIRTWAAADDVCVSINDTGKGIPLENLTKLFTPFFTTKPVGAGTGLGLSISYGIVQKHGGRIEVASKVGSGTTFTVVLPRKGVA